MGDPRPSGRSVGGIILHQGRIAEMKTGEGKTLVATLPAYLNALAGKGVHIGNRSSRASTWSTWGWTRLSSLSE